MGRGLMWGMTWKLLYYSLLTIYLTFNKQKQKNVLKYCLLNAEYNTHKCNFF